MVIGCPECTTRFVVSPEKIGEGRRVRCGVCRHEWFYSPPSVCRQEQPVPILDSLGCSDTVIPFPAGGNVPALIADIETPGILYRTLQTSLILLAASMLLLLFLLSVNRMSALLPSSEAVYQFFGVYRTDGLSLQDILVEPAQNGKLLKIKGVIVNQGTSERYLPMIRVTLYGKDRAVLHRYRLDVLRLPRILPVGQEVRFEQQLPVKAQHTQEVVLDIGNPLELLLH